MSDTKYTPIMQTTKTLFTWLSIAWIVGMLLFYVFLYVNDPYVRPTLELMLPDNVQNWIKIEFELKPCRLSGYCSGKDVTEGKVILYSFLLVPPIALYALFSLFSYFSGKNSDYKTGKKILNSISEHNYLVAYNEVENEKIKSPELWAKAFALSDGDIAKQKSIYVELRARQLDGKL